MTNEEYQIELDRILPSVVDGMSRPTTPIETGIDFAKEFPQLIENDPASWELFNLLMVRFLSNDARFAELVVKTAQANKLLQLNEDKKLPADVTGNAETATKLKTARTISLTGAVTGSATTDFSGNVSVSLTLEGVDASKITSGKIDIARLPPSVLERIIVVKNNAARFALTTGQAQEGDTVKVTDTGAMYFVVDSSKLNAEAGYESYAVGTAGSVPWSGITGKPDTYSPTAHTHIKDQVGLGNVDNTADSQKTVMAATTAATCTGNAATATNAENANKLIGKVWNWSGQGGQPAWLWGGSNGTDMYVYNPSNFNVNYANTAGSANAVAWSNITGKPNIPTTSGAVISGTLPIGSGPVITLPLPAGYTEDKCAFWISAVVTNRLSGGAGSWVKSVYGFTTRTTRFPINPANDDLYVKTFGEYTVIGV